MNNEYIKIKLKDKWDNPRCVDDFDNDCGVYWGRKQEIAYLKNILVNKSRSSLLLGAPRGRGKTTLIHETINEIKNENKYKIVPIFIDAPQLEAKNKSDINYINILEHIIVSLHSSFKIEDSLKFRDAFRIIGFKWKLNNLYKKILATKWKKSRSQIFIRTYFLKFDWLFYWAIAISGLLFNQLLLSLEVSLGIFILVQVYRKVISSELYIFERDYNNLEHFFKQLFKFKFKKIKFVFIIDELDFFMLVKEKNGNKIIELTDVTETCIPEIVKAYKNLFHYVNANFIFIGDNNLYNQVDANKESVYSTIFSDNIYLSPPQQKDLFEYLDKIIYIPNVDKKTSQMTTPKLVNVDFEQGIITDTNLDANQQYNLLKYYCMYLGKGDFRFTIKHLKDYITEDNYIFVDQNRFTVKEQAMAKSYRLIASLYDSLLSNKPTQQAKNEEWFNSLFKIIDPDIWNNCGKSISVKDLYSKNLEINENQIYLLNFLEESKVIEIVRTDNGDIVNIKGIISANIPDSFKSLTYFENELKNNYNEVNDYVRKIADELLPKEEKDKDINDWLQSKTNILVPKILNNSKELLDKISNDLKEKGIRKIVPKAEIEPKLDELNSLKEQLEKSRFDLYRNKLASELVDYFIVGKIDVNEQIFKLLPDIKNEILKINHFLFYIPSDFSKQLIILDNKDNSYIEKINNLIAEKGLSFSCKVINVDFSVKEVVSWGLNFTFNNDDNDWFVESGVPQKIEKDLILQVVPGVIRDQSGQLNTSMFLNKNLNSGFYEAEVLLDNGGVFNIVMSRNGSSEAEKYFMVRIDTRQGDNAGSGILIKDIGQFWKYLKIKKRFVAQPQQWIKILLKFDKDGIIFSRYNEKDKPVIIDRYKTNLESGEFGFFNELGQVKLRNIKVNYEENTSA